MLTRRSVMVGGTSIFILLTFALWLVTENAHAQLPDCALIGLTGRIDALAAASQNRYRRRSALATATYPPLARQSI